MTEHGSLEATPEQVLYAKVLSVGMYFGLGLLFVTYAIYVCGFLTPEIPFEDLSHYWTLSVHEYVEEAGIETGWGWVGMLGKGDFLNFIGIALLAGVTVLCYVCIIPVLARSKDWIFVILAVLEIAVLSLAASGILKAGGH